MDNNLKVRIQKLMEIEQMNPASFAKAIQVNPSAISHILNDRNKPSTDILTKILTNFRTLNSEWLILGVGNMYKSDKQTDSVNLNTSLFSSEPESIQENTADSGNFTPTNQNENIISTESNTHPDLKEPVVIEKEVIKEIMVHAPEKKLEKIIVYYSDNSFEEFTSQNK